MISTFAELLAPIDETTFFAEHYEKTPLHLRSPANMDRSLLSHDDLFLALFAKPQIPTGLIVFPEHIGTTRETLLGDMSVLALYIAEGHPIVWNHARGVHPAIDALSALLSDVFGGAVWPNIYATGTAGTPFDAHFDSHEVIAIQCEGEKDWWLSEVRVDRPLDAPEMEAAVATALALRRDEALDRTLLQFRVSPSDVVYIPRGQFHNATAAGGRSLHVTFGIRPPSAFEVVAAHLRELLGDSLLREMMPAHAADPDGAKSLALLSEVAHRLQAEFQPSKLLRAKHRLAEGWAHSRR